MFDEIARGVYLEGLCADARSVWVADPIAGGVRRFTEDGAAGAWLADRRWIGSLLRGPGDIVLVSGEDGIVLLDAATGGCEPFVMASGGANEMVADVSGAVWFGGSDIPAIAAGRPTKPVSLHRREPDGRVVALAHDLRFSNGVALSPDGRTLYHNETFVGTSAYAIGPDGSLGEARRLLDKPDCDGLAVDADGTLWITGFETAAIMRLRTDGAPLDPLPIPGGGATSVRFGGSDLRTLYVTTVEEGAAMKLAAGIWPKEPTSILLRARSDVAGLRPHRASLDGSATRA